MSNYVVKLGLADKKNWQCEICEAFLNIRKPGPVDFAWWIREDTELDKTTKAHLHHRNGNEKNNKENNLMLLCGPCHIRLHRIKDYLSRRASRELLKIQQQVDFGY